MKRKRRFWAKKAVSAFVAAGLVLGSWSVFPASDGIAGKLGLSGSAYAAELADQDLMKEIDQVWGQLEADEEAVVVDVWGQINAALDDPDKYTAIIDPFYQVLDKATNSFAGNYNYIDNKQSLAAFLFAWSEEEYSSDGAFLESWRTNEVVRGTAAELAALAKVDPSVFNFENAEEALEALKESVGKVLADPDLFWDLVEEGDFSEVSVAKVLARNVLETLRADHGDLAFVQVIDSIEQNTNLTKNDVSEALIDTLAVVLEEIEGADAAAVSLAAAAVRANAELASASTTGRTLSLQLELYGADIPNSILKWSTSHANASIDDNVLTYSGSRPANVDVTAALAVPVAGFENKVIYKGTVRFGTSSSGGSGGGGGGSAVTAPEVELSDKVDDLLKDLNNLVEQWQQASDEERAKLLEKALKAVEEAAKELARFDVSDLVKVTDGKATLQLDADALADALKEAKEKLAELNGLLKTLDPNAKAIPFTVRLVLGDIDASVTEVTLDEDAVEVLAEEGVQDIAAEVNGFAITLPTSELDGETVLTISEDEQSAGEATGLPAASDVYTINLTVDGKSKTRFSDPLKLAVPVDTAGVDRALLTLVRISGGSYEFVGGMVVDGVLVAERRTLSTYAVVENQVEFADTASVESWAGRAIDIAAAKGIVQGKGNAKFDPAGDVTRAEFAKMIAKTFFLEDGTTTESFGDVADGDWYQTYVAVAAKHGIVNGRSQELFAPQDKITREELATMIARAMVNIWGYSPAADAESELAQFSDASLIDDVHRANVAFVVQQGLMIGNNGKFNPDGYATRAEAAVVIQRLLDAYAGLQ